MTAYWWVLIPIGLVIVLTLVSLSRRRSRPRETAMEAYVEGLRSLTAGDEQTAFVKFRQAVDQDTGNIDAYLKMGDIFRNRGLTEKALQVHRELTLRNQIPAELQSEIDKSLALDYIRAGMTGKAYEVLERIIKDSSTRVWAAERLLDLYIKDKKWKEAAALYEDTIRKSGRSDDSLLASIKLLVGRGLHENEEYHKARLLYKEALSLDEDNPLPYLYIAESYVAEKRVEDGLDFLKRLCDDVPRYAYLGFPMLEETLFELGRFGEVEDIYRNVLNKDVGNMPTRISLAGILEKKGELSQAESLLKSVLDADPVNMAAAVRLVNIMATRHRVDDGLEILTGMVSKVAHNPEFKCRRCGKGLSRPQPACPQCGAVGTFI